MAYQTKLQSRKGKNGSAGLKLAELSKSCSPMMLEWIKDILDGATESFIKGGAAEQQMGAAGPQNQLADVWYAHAKAEADVALFNAQEFKVSATCRVN